MADTPPMHSDFARWYATVSLGDDAARRTARWKAIAAITANAERATVESLLRLAFATRHVPHAAAVQSIRQAFKSTDDTFSMNGNDRELQVLAAACLAVLMDSSETIGPDAALAVTTTSFSGVRRPDLPMDLAQVGEHAIARWGEVNRERPPLTGSLSSEPPKFDFDKAAAKVREQPNADGFAAAFVLAADATRAATAQLAVRQESSIRVVDQFIRVQDEELQMLWWLIGQRSTVCDCSFDAIHPDLQPLVFASELAQQTELLPGPASIKALLSRAGLRERKNLSVAAAVNEGDSTWLRQLLGEEDVSPVSTPIHEAIKRRLETGAGSAWIAGWAATAGAPPDYVLPSLTLGNLFYRECLLRLFR